MPSRLRSLSARLVAVLAGAVLVACAGAGTDGATVSDGANPTPLDGPYGMLAPSRGAWFGVSIDWSEDSLADYAGRLGHRPAVAVSFTSFPMSAQEEVWLDQAVDQAKGEGSALLLTLEPRHGLEQITPDAVSGLAERLAGYNAQGVDVYLRFAHEMNGSWYAWGQQPTAYVAAFRAVADAIHGTARRTAMMWAPSYGGGYPFAGGRYQAKPGSADARALDTDGDGTLTQADDPYLPYWPGKDYVDWVGMSLYHWGDAYPWGENEIPEAGKFLDLMRGTYDGLGSDESAVPDFYAIYGEGMHLPVAITETAALYVPGRGGDSELAVKSAWWDQVFAPGNSEALPWLKMVNWFEWRKDEREAGGVVDWTATTTTSLRTAFVAALPDWLDYAPVPRP